MTPLKTTMLVSTITTLAAGCSGDGTDFGAYPDYATIAVEETVIIDVLENDIGVDGDVAVEFADSPVAGLAEDLGDGRFQYTPADLYIGADAFRYKVTNEAGDSAEATVSIDVGCEECMNGANVRLRWAPNDPVEQVIGYRVYFGLTEDAQEMQMIADVTAETPGFDYDNPGVAYDAWYDLQLELGDTACFRATAYNVAGESDFSIPVCKEMTDKAQSIIRFDL